MLKSLAKGAGLLLLAGGAVVAFKTVTFKPGDVADASKIKVAAALPIDVDGAAERLGAAIRFQTISHQDPAENKAEEWNKLQSWLQSTYPKVHALMKREIIGQGTLVYEWAGSDASAKPIILMAHQDVVPVTAGTEKDWKHSPFGGEIAEGAVWGRGAVDDKGSLVTLFEGLETLAKSGFKPKRTIWLVSGHDEEVGGTGAKAASEWLAARKVKALFTLDEGSAIIEDAPVINGPAILIGVAEKGFATLKVTANAPGGHSSMPPKEIGTVNLAKAVVAIHSAQFPNAIRPPVSNMLETLADAKGGMPKAMVANRWLFGGLLTSKFSETPAGAAMLHTTISPTMLEGSPKENVLPQSANALINFRIAPGQNSADVLKHVKLSTGNLPVEYSWVKPPREPTPVSSSTSEGWKYVSAAAQAEMPNAPVAPYLVVAGTDSRNFYGVSDDVYRFMAARLKTAETRMIHGTNEHATLKNIESMIQFYIRLIATSAG